MFNRIHYDVFLLFLQVIAWGDPAFGGDLQSVEVLKRPHVVRQIQATDAAFAAIQADGTVIAWGDPKFGGDASNLVLAKMHGCNFFLFGFAVGMLFFWFVMSRKYPQVTLW